MTQAVKLWGTKQALWEGLGISRQAIGAWPEKLDRRKINEILGASVRAGLI